jgi:hypothetical protein
MTRRAQALHGIALLLAASLSQAEPFGYVVNSDDPSDDAFSLVRVDLATGDHTVIGDTGYIDVEGLSFSSDGTLYGVDDATKTLLTLDLDTGQATPVGGGDGNLGLPTGPDQGRDFGLTFDAAGTLWLSSDVTGEVWRVDPDTGELTPVVTASGSMATTSAGGDGKSHSSTQPHLTGMASCGDTLFSISVNNGQSLYRAERDPYEIEEVGPLGAGLEFDDGGLSFDANGTLWGIADRSTFQEPGTSETTVLEEPSIIFTVDPTTGAATETGSTVVGVESLAIASPDSCAQGQGGNHNPTHPIPAHSGAGLALLILALGLGAWPAVRRA